MLSGASPSAIDRVCVLFCYVVFCLSWLGFMFGLPCGVQFIVLVGGFGGVPWLGLLAVAGVGWWGLTVLPMTAGVRPGNVIACSLSCLQLW